ncbi:hypothetical protein [Anaerospora hongkongensis]|jgi:hypothetical protein|uniref:hypothetical protein n=1 Tax=Anaerospora hongkongensis TaxID=244830 RepID=UPI00289F42F8|nr:hypothetical protein [Anaerospora hongkongensis]
MNLKRIKPMWSILVILGLTLITCTAALANSPALWQITPEQKQNMQATLQQANEQIRQIKANNPHPSGAIQLRDQTKAIQSVRLTAIQEVLNTMPHQQQTAWNEFLAQGRENRKSLLQELALSQQQRLKLVPILENAKAAAWEAAANPTLTIEDIQNQMRQQNRLAASQVRTILKPNQQTKFDNWKQTHGKVFWLL